jgi:hypothetical protein
MNTEQVNIFTDAVSEYTNLLSPNPSIDFTDSSVPAGISIAPGSQLGGSGYLVTAQIPALGYYEVQFMLANTFWNCNFNFGNSACGVQIRQGIAHMIDRPKFAAGDPHICAGCGVPIDNPLPTNADGNLLSPDSCNWDAPPFAVPCGVGLCAVGSGVAATSVGGCAYRLGPGGVVPCPGCQAPGSADLNAAAQHFVNAGLATGFDAATSVLTGLLVTCPGAGCTVPNFFIRTDDPARLDLGNGYAQQICYLFTGSYTTPCAYLSRTLGPTTQVLVYTTSTTIVNRNWWMYTAAFNDVTFYDDSLYHIYNSRFVSGVGIADQPPCSAQAVPSYSAPDYMYLCSSTYDSLSNQMETSPCLSAPGDPLAGATSNLPTGPNFGVCSGTILSSHSAGIQAEDYFGQNVFTLPVFELNVQFGYLQCQPPAACVAGNSWVRAINNAEVGLPNYFTWLNAYNPAPAVPGTIRQGFSQSAASVNPFIASSAWDLYIVGNVYDSLYSPNPLAPSGQQFNWMTINTVEVPNNSLTYIPPSSTATTYRFTLRPDLTFQDGRLVTSYDVAFSYLSMVGSGAFLATGASSMTGITIFNAHQLDINVNSLGPFVLPNLTGIPIVTGMPIMPGRYWSSAGPAAWDASVAACSNNPCPLVQYTLTGPNVNCVGGCPNFPPALMTVDPVKITPTYDPIANHSFVGSGPWQCGGGANLGFACSTPLGTGNHATSYTLTAFPNYFRSSQRLAIYLWSGESDTNAIGPATAVAACFNAAVNLAGPCGHYQQGAGNPGPGTPVSVSTVGNVDIFFNMNWLAPFEWTTGPPIGIAPLPPLFYGPGATFTPNPGGASCTVPNTYYDC